MGTDKLTCVIFDTKGGWVGILGSSPGLVSVTLPQRSPEEARRRLGERLGQVADSPRSFEDLVQRLCLYFQGRRVSFPDKLDLSEASAFEREVWVAARLIPYGETRSYGWVAGHIKRPGAARAVGQALGRNPFPIVVPCHRVIASDGGLGGFGGGLDMKRYLLSLEGAAGGKMG